MAGLIKRGSIWWVQYYLGGDRIRESTGERNKKQAQFYKSEIERLIHYYQTGVPQSETIDVDRIGERIKKSKIYKYLQLKSGSIFGKMPITLGDFYPVYIDYSRTINRDRVIVQKRQMLTRIINHIGNDIYLHEITSKKILEYQIKRSNEGVANSTINQETSRLLALLRQASEMDYQLANPFPKINKLKVPRKRAKFYTPDEVRLLIKLSEKLQPDYHAAVLTMANTGMRMEEYYYLPWSHVQIDRGIITIDAYREWIPKSNEYRDIPMTKTLHGFLVDRRIKNPNDEYVRGKITWFQFERFFPQMARAAGLDGTNRTLSIRLFRQSLATYLHDQNVPLTTIRDILGHADINTTMRYIGMVADSMRDGMAKLDY